MRRLAIILATLAPLSSACHRQTSLAPEAAAPPLRVSWARASRAWWADVALAEPAIPVLLQRLPNGVWRSLGAMQAANGAPLATGRHEFRVPVWACPREAVMQEGGTEQMALTYAEVAPTRSVSTTDVAKPMTANTVVTAEVYGTPARAPELSCAAGSLPEYPEVVAALFPNREGVDAFQGLPETSGADVASLRSRVETLGGRLLTAKPHR